MRLPIDSLRLDGGTQPRGMIDYSTVEEYAIDMKAGATFPPVVVFFDGADHWLADGFHRVKASRAADRSEIEADVRQGTRDDAVWYSCGANVAHGLRRTNADKRRAVETALRLVEGGYSPPGLRGDSSRAFAEHCGVSDNLVNDIRRELEPALLESSNQRTRTDRNGRARTTTPANQAKGGKASAKKRKQAKEPAVTAPSAPANEEAKSTTSEPAQPIPMKARDDIRTRIVAELVALGRERSLALAEGIHGDVLKHWQQQRGAA